MSAQANASCRFCSRSPLESCLGIQRWTGDLEDRGAMRSATIALPVPHATIRMEHAPKMKASFRKGLLSTIDLDPLLLQSE
jgi:hypothetical protein